jgi:hypothetical protein
MSVTANASSRRSRNGLHCCETCGESFTPTRSDGRYCSGACRQKAYRRRTQSRIRANPGSRVDGNCPPRLTAEMRRLLRAAIDRRRRQLLIVSDAAPDAADRELFADHEVAA